MLLLALLTILPFDTAARERVDQIEVQFTHSWSACEAETKSMTYSASDMDSEVLERTLFKKEWRRDLVRKGRE